MILVFGSNGQVATHLRTVAGITAIGRDGADLSNPEQCAAKILSLKPRCVINAAAYTQVDMAESNETEANVVNGYAPAAMAKACAKLRIPMVHISTDYVFHGKGETPFLPEDKLSPINAYGRSKLLGETLIQEAGCQYAILRTSWVFSSHGHNFLKSMLRLGRSNPSLSIVGDQIGGPTPAKAIAEACITIADTLVSATNAGGIYHFSGAPDVSWAQFAKAIFASENLDVSVREITTAEYKTPAARPLNSRLDCSNLADFGLTRPDWRQAVDNILNELRTQ